MVETNLDLLNIREGKIGLGTAAPDLSIAPLPPKPSLTWKGDTASDPLTIRHISGTVGLSITADGKVGVGTASPTGARLVIEDATSTAVNINATTGGYGLSLGADANQPWIGSRTNHDLRIVTNSSEKLRVTADGKVGIGTGATAPGAKLEVVGDIKVTGKIVTPEGTIRDDNGGWVRTYADTGWYSQTHGGGWYMTDSTWIRSYGSKSIYHNAGTLRTDGTLQVGDGGSTLSVARDGNFAYRTNVLFADTAGRVGIGTNTPSEKLVVYDAVRSVVQVHGDFGAQVSGSGGGNAVFGTNLYVNQANELRTAGTHTNNYGYAGVHATWGQLKFYAQTGNTTADVVVTPSPRMTLASDGTLSVAGPVVAPNILSFQSGVLAVDTHETNFRTGSGARTIDRAIVFSTPFTNAPKVVVGLIRFDIEKVANSRLDVVARDVTKAGFTIRLTTWADTKIWSVNCSWFAYGR